MTKPNIVAVLILLHCSVSIAGNNNDRLDQFCQDLNIVLTKTAVINLNIQNAETTRTAEGGPYVRKVLDNCSEGICRIVKDNSLPIHKFDPRHPDANDKGYVPYPNININEELDELTQLKRIKAAIMENKPFKSKDLLENKKMKHCFSKYSYIDKHFNYRKFLDRKKI